MAEKQMYLAHVIPGNEQSVAEDILKRAESEAASSMFNGTYVPVHSDTGKPLHPGYVYVIMELNEKTWSIVRNTKHVSGIVGTSGEPIPLSPADAENILSLCGVGEKIPFSVGDNVLVLSGPFRSFICSVLEINEETGEARVGFDFRDQPQKIWLPIMDLQKIRTKR